MKRLTLKQIAKLLPRDLILSTAQTLLSKGLSRDQIIDEVTELIDAELDFTKIIKNPKVGEAVEAVDGPIIKLIVGLIIARI